MTTRLDATHRGLDPTKMCSCVSVHNPRLIPEMLNVHHVVPRSWQGPDVPANRVVICSNCHAAVHGCLNEYVRVKGTPPLSVLRRYPRYARMLAQRAVDQLAKEGRGIPHIFTTHEPEAPHA